MEIGNRDLVGTCLRNRNGTSELMIGHVGLGLACSGTSLLKICVLVAILELV